MYVPSSLDPRLQLCYVANKDVTLQQLKLEIIGSVTDTLITSASPALAMKKIQGLVF